MNRMMNGSLLSFLAVILYVYKEDELYEPCFHANDKQKHAHYKYHIFHRITTIRRRIQRTATYSHKSNYRIQLNNYSFGPTFGILHLPSLSLSLITEDLNLVTV